MVKKILFFLISLWVFTFPVYAVNYPRPAGFVNDFANLYSAAFKENLEAKLSDFEKKTGNEIVVVTIESLEGQEVESYAVGLFEKWGIGKKGKNNGLLLLIAKKEREVRIEVGYGLEPYISDGRAGEIIRSQIIPYFKEENYEKGTEAGLEKIFSYLENKDIASQEVNNVSETPKAVDFIVVLGFIFFYLFTTYLAGYLGRTKEIWPGGVIGAILGGIGGALVGAVFGLVLGAFVFGGLGLFLDYILTKNYRERKSRGLPTDFWHSWGGFSRGGSFGGRGFGGFGGGLSGGGGASGRW